MENEEKRKEKKNVIFLVKYFRIVCYLIFEIHLLERMLKVTLKILTKNDVYFSTMYNIHE